MLFGMQISIQHSRSINCNTGFHVHAFELAEQRNMRASRVQCGAEWPWDFEQCILGVLVTTWPGSLLGAYLSIGNGTRDVVNQMQDDARALHMSWLGIDAGCLTTIMCAASTGQGTAARVGFDVWLPRAFSCCPLH
jgi:hypothetical protein